MPKSAKLSCQRYSGVFPTFAGCFNMHFNDLLFLVFIDAWYAKTSDRKVTFFLAKVKRFQLFFLQLQEVVSELVFVYVRIP